MKVKIVRCNNDRKWYKNEIGNVFYVGKMDHDKDYRVLDDEDLGRYIAEEDLIIIKDDWTEIICKEYEGDFTLDPDTGEVMSIRYRKRKLKPPTVEELAEEYANSKTCYKTPIKEAYTAGYNDAKKE